MMEALFGGESETWDEDCLYLNVWTPDVSPADPLPVMVWIHGGGFEMGSGSSPLYDGTPFARNGVVLVTLNYRLGAFGFCELGHLDPDYAGSGNVGLLDQVAALEWVRDHIAAFGGDPAQVTVFGESAGAMSIAALLAMPRAKGLFHRAVLQSGAASAPRSVDHAVADTAEFMAAVGVDSVEDLVRAEPAQLLAAHAAIAAGRIADPEAVIERTGTPLAFLAFRPVADGRELPTDVLGAIAEGSAADIPLMVGTTSEEWKLFALMRPGPVDDDEWLQRAKLVTNEPDAALAALPRRAPRRDRGRPGVRTVDRPGLPHPGGAVDRGAATPRAGVPVPLELGESCLRRSDRRSHAIELRSCSTWSRTIGCTSSSAPMRQRRCRG